MTVIHKLFHTLFSPRKSAAHHASLSVQRIPLHEHGITAQQISPGALKIIRDLQKAGFAAFIVGGAVRDLLLKKSPKDFDIVTSATPEEIRRLFRRARIIGRRFQLVHIMQGRELIEVSTFRSNMLDRDIHINESGRIVRDNVFGSHEQDATRRDFTINALFYEPSKQEIWDFFQGMTDVQQKTLRIIGNAKLRYREDPIRMLRAIRHAAKLNLDLDHDTEAPIQKLSHLLQDVPAARLFNEVIKLFLSGHAVQSIQRLKQHKLHSQLFPALEAALQYPASERFIMLALENTDQRLQQDKTVAPGFLLATLFWHNIVMLRQEHQKNGMKHMQALHTAITDVCAQQAAQLAITKYFTTYMKEVWMLQPRLENPVGKRPYHTLEHPRFRAGYDFLLLRCQAGELPLSIAEWWDHFAQATPEERSVMLEPKAPSRRRRRPGNTTAPKH